MYRSGILFFGVVLVLGGCGSTEPSNLVTKNPELTPGDTVTPPAPPDTAPGDSTPVPDTLPPPPPPPPPDTSGPGGPPYVPTHVGIPFGPTETPADQYGPEFSGSVLRADPRTLLADLERARRVNARLLVNFTGNERAFRDEKGFNFATWKRRVDRFRDIDFSSYVQDGTFLAHFIMDEPDDPSNWNGERVPPAMVEEMAKYSKEIWPSVPTLVAVWPSYLKGHRSRYIDAVRVHYHTRFGSLETFMANHTRDAKEGGYALISGINLLNGGNGESGVRGRDAVRRWVMSAREITAYGNAIMADPYLCGFLMWEYDSKYLAKPDVKAALADLKKKAEAHPQRACQRSG